MLRFDGKYKIIAAYPETSVYSINMPNAPLMYTTFHVSKSRPYCKNDSALFPSRILPQPGPVVMSEGEVELLVDSIIDECKCSQGQQYLVCYVGYGPNHDRWMSCTELLENEALDRWEQHAP